MKRISLLLIAIVALLATTAAFAGGEKGKSDESHGKSALAHAAKGTHGKSGDQVLGATSGANGKSSAAHGKSDEAHGNAGVQSNAGGRSEDAHHHVIICHRTGSESNPYVVINIPWTAWEEAHSPDTGSHPTLNGRDDIMLEDPAPGPGTKAGHTKDECEQQVAGGEVGEHRILAHHVVRPEPGAIVLDQAVGDRDPAVSAVVGGPQQTTGSRGCEEFHQRALARPPAHYELPDRRPPAWYSVARRASFDGIRKLRA